MKSGELTGSSRLRHVEGEIDDYQIRTSHGQQQGVLHICSGIATYQSFDSLTVADNMRLGFMAQIGQGLRKMFNWKGADAMAASFFGCANVVAPAHLKDRSGRHTLGACMFRHKYLHVSFLIKFSPTVPRARGNVCIPPLYPHGSEQDYLRGFILNPHTSASACGMFD